MNTIRVSIAESTGSKKAVTINGTPGKTSTKPLQSAGTDKTRLRTLISQKLPEGDIHLILDIHKDLDALPFELIYDNRFISLDTPLHIIRRGLKS